jgi:hypothetical protein
MICLAMKGRLRQGRPFSLSHQLGGRHASGKLRPNAVSRGPAAVGERHFRFNSASCETNISRADRPALFALDCISPCMSPGVGLDWWTGYRRGI